MEEALRWVRDFVERTGDERVLVDPAGGARRMRLANPEALLLLLLVPPLLWWIRGRAAPVGMGYPALGDLAGLRPSWRARMRRALPWLRALVLILTVVALARPQWGVEATKVLREGIAIAMVVDVSSSMGALDLQIGDRQVNRLDAVKEAFRDFVSGDGEALPGRDGDVIAMITFARFADVLSPLDARSRGAARPARAGRAGARCPRRTAPRSVTAMVLAIERLRAAEGAGKVMILLTDGSHNAGDAEPLDAAQIAGALGIKDLHHRRRDPGHRADAEPQSRRQHRLRARAGVHRRVHPRAHRRH